MLDEDYLIATYYLETPLELEKAAKATAAEQSTGTWTKVEFETSQLIKQHGAEVVEVEEMERGKTNRGIIKIAFPLINFGPVIPMLLSTVAGNLYEMADLTNVKLLDLEFPKGYVEEFRGPKFGIEGTRGVVEVYDRPLIGCIVKPCAGLKPRQFAEACYRAAVGGVDFIKDDELVANPRYSPIEERVSSVMDALDKSEEETGEKTMYAANVTDEVDKIMENADVAMESGANCLMLNFVTAGFSALRVLAEDPSVKVPIHCHRDMFGSFTRSEVHGIHTFVVSKLARLCGGDQVHVGAVYGKLYEGLDSVMKSVEALREEWFDLEAALPVSSGGQHPGKVPENIKHLGNDALILAGGGIFGHNGGAISGARAMRQALDASLQGISIEEYAKDHKELRVAIEQWGTIDIGKSFSR